jgi:hypothetical protein
LLLLAGAATGPRDRAHAAAQRQGSAFAVVELHLRARAATASCNPTTWAGVLTVEPAAGEPEGPPEAPGDAPAGATEAVTIPPDGRVVLQLARDRAWRLRLEVPGCWAAPVALPGAAPEPWPATVEVPLWPAARLRARFEGRPADLQGIESARITLVAAPSRKKTAGDEAIPWTTIPCPVRQGAVDCLLPAVRLDLKVEVAGFAPRYFWDQTFVPGQPRDLGALPLEPASALTGQVLAADQRPLGRPLTVRLIPLEAVGGPAARSEDRRRLLTVVGQATDQGTFQVDGLASGSYTVEVEPPPGYSPARREGVVLAAGAGRVLEEPLVLQHLQVLRVAIDPPLDPAGFPWRVRLERYLEGGAGLSPLLQEPATTDGTFERAGLGQGHYQLTLEGEDGTRWHSQALRLEEGSQEVAVSLPLVPLVGTIHAGDRPLQVQLDFLDLTGASVTVTSDAEGHFTGILPAPGAWRVRVRPVEGGQHYLDYVEIERAPGEPAAVIHLRLPSTRIAGQVVDAEGAGMARALVTAFRDGRPVAQRWTDEEGRFEFLGIEAGQVELRAETRDAETSEFVAVELDAEQESEDLELVVAASRRLVVRFDDGAAPLRGGRVLGRDPDSPFEVNAVLGVQGELVLDLPPGVRRLDLVVVPPALPTALVALSVPESDAATPVRVTLDRLGGRLRLPLPEEGSLFLGRGARLFPVHWFFPPPRDGRLPGLEGGTLALELAPGDYVVCLEPRMSRRCASGYLAPGGELSLSPHVDARRSATAVGAADAATGRAP